MSPFKLAWAYLRARPLNTLLNVLLLALGVAMIVVLMLFIHQMQQRMTRDARGIDLVVGAKGSPMQLILSSIFHLDIPTGNIALKDAELLRKHAQVKSVIPLALGDSYRSFRIVGTQHSYVQLYGGELAQGALWQAPLEAVLGAEAARKLGLQVGNSFIGSHGLEEGGSGHEQAPYKVVGVLKATGSVLDRLVLTGVESVWAVHGHHAAVPTEHEDEHHDEHEEDARATEQASAPREVTALLVRYATPLAAVGLPRYVNSNSAMQAAAPALESARLFQLVGFGVDTLRAFAGVLIFSAALSVFIALTNALQERRYDLAVLRTLGADRAALLRLMLTEGLLLALIGAVAGVLLGHLAMELLGQWLARTRHVEMTGLIFLPQELWLIALALGVGLVATLVPAYLAYRTDIAQTLAKE